MQAVFPPPVCADVSMIEREIIPRVPSRAVILPYRPPLSLGEVRPPTPPLLVSLICKIQTFVFGRRHSYHGISHRKAPPQTASPRMAVIVSCRYDTASATVRASLSSRLRSG